jgi:hypothetical protein
MKFDRKLLSLFFFFFSFLGFSQVDTLYSIEQVIYLSNGEIIEPGFLPKNTDIVTYTFCKVNDDKDLLLVKGLFKDGSSVLGFYRNVKCLASDGSFYTSWEQDLLWLKFDSNASLIEQKLYSEGKLISDKSNVFIQHNE